MATVTKHIRYGMSSCIKNSAGSKQKIIFAKEVTLALLLSGHTETMDYNIMGSSYHYIYIF